MISTILFSWSPSISILSTHYRSSPHMPKSLKSRLYHFFYNKCYSMVPKFLSNSFIPIMSTHPMPHSHFWYIKFAVSSPILAPGVSPWGWSPGSGSASSSNRSTFVRTPSQHQFVGYFTWRSSLTPYIKREPEDLSISIGMIRTFLYLN